MVFVIVLLVAFRYFLQQREELSAVAVKLRDSVSEDAIALYNLAYNSGVRARGLYEETLPKVKEIAARFNQDAE